MAQCFQHIRARYLIRARRIIYSMRFLTILSLKKLIYPGIFVFLFGVLLFLFILSARFISMEINRIFSADEPRNNFSVNTAQYTLLAKKLGLPAQTQEAEPAPTQIEASAPAATTTQESTPLDKAALSIGVFNGSNATGAAGKLAATLTAQGFVVAKTGNEAQQEKNTIEIKESKKAYLALLAPVLPEFDTASATILPETAHYDCILTIGEK